MRYGVIATVGWRAQALEITAEHLAAQTAHLDALLMFYDGPCPMSADVERHLGRMAGDVLVQMAPVCSGGAWERIRRASDLFGGDGDLFVFDDDMRYPADYVEVLSDHDSNPTGGARGLGGVDLDGNGHSYVSRTDGVAALELQLGTSVVPLSSLAGLAETNVAREMLSAGGWATEAVLGWWWWMHGVKAWIVPGPVQRPSPVILPAGGATDPRALYLASGKRRHEDTWRKLDALTGWPSAVLPPGHALARLRASP